MPAPGSNNELKTMAAASEPLLAAAPPSRQSAEDWHLDRYAGTSMSKLFTELGARSDIPKDQHESLDYDSVFNAGYVEELKQTEARRRWFGYSGATFYRWILTVLVRTHAPPGRSALW